MVEKLLFPKVYAPWGFESSVNSYGRKTTLLSSATEGLFESSVNSYGRKTNRMNDIK